MTAGIRLLVLLIALVPAGAAFSAESALCGGRSLPLVEGFGSTPHVELSVDQKPGIFLVDYGATQGTLWTRVSGNGPATRAAAIDLPGVVSANFLLRLDAGASHLGAPSGVLGTDVLSHLTVQLGRRQMLVSDAACDPATLRAAGYRAIDQTGFFASDPAFTMLSRPIVPVIFLRFGDTQVPAQIDTGYADAAGSHSIDINQVLFDRLNRRTALVPDGSLVVTTCDGTETRAIYRSPTQSVVVTDEGGVAIATVDRYRLIPKQRNGCGGIASANEPAAQIGASFIAALGTLVFEPRAHRVWIGERR